MKDSTEERGERVGGERSTGRRALTLLALGAGSGLLLAAVGLLMPTSRSGQDLPDGAVALVNGESIRRDSYERLLAGLESDSRNPIDDSRRRHVLDRMIEEELLVQRALELGLAQLDRRVRADLTSSLIASVVSSAEDREPETAELREFYQEQRDFFTQPGRFRVRQIFFRVPEARGEAETRARAEAARDALGRGRDLAELAADLGDREISPVPDALLPALKLREYIGPTALRSVLELEVGEVSEPVRSGTGIHLLELVEKEPARTPPFEQIEAQVRNEWRRRSGDRALRAYLDELRANGDVVTSPVL